MPPNGSYSSRFDGSFRIVASKNPAKHGNGSALIENGVDLFGSSDQYFRATNAGSDLYVQSAKILILTQLPLLIFKVKMLILHPLPIQLLNVLLVK